MNKKQALVLLAATLVLLCSQGCYVKVGDETILGQEDTAFPNASIERGCVVKIERGNKSFPPDYVVLFHKVDDSRETFVRNAKSTSDLKVGKCYEWKLGFHDASVGSVLTDGLEAMKAISSDTVREIVP